MPAEHMFFPNRTLEFPFLLSEAQILREIQLSVPSYLVALDVHLVVFVFHQHSRHLLRELVALRRRRHLLGDDQRRARFVHLHRANVQ